MIMNVLISSLSLADSVTKPKMFCKMNERNVFLSYMSATLFQKFNFKKSLKSIICKLILQTDCIQKASFGVLSQLCNSTERQTRASKIYKLRNLSTVIICHFFFALRQKFHFAVAARLFFAIFIHHVILQNTTEYFEQLGNHYRKTECQGGLEKRGQ